MHLLHARSDDDDAIPLVLIHGWPGSIVEFLDVVPQLRERFHVVVFSIPGYGFSGPTTVRGFDVAKVAGAVADVMAQLGYDRYVAQGGDWGALVVRHLGQHHPPHVAAIHTNMLFSPFDGDGSDAMTGVTEGELGAIVASAERLADGTAYMSIQATRPHSIGFGLDDSPLGLAGWILEKFHAWCDIRDGMPIRTDRLIDNLMLYWLTGNGDVGGSVVLRGGARRHWAAQRVDGPRRRADGIRGLSLRAGADTAGVGQGRYNLVHYSVQDRGGHFAAFEQPGLFAGRPQRLRRHPSRVESLLTSTRCASHARPSYRRQVLTNSGTSRPARLVS